MAYNIKLVVHGVPPKGQQVWRSEDSDNYIESFYGRKTSVLAQLLVEVIQGGGRVYCYYTYWRKGNVLGRNGKAGTAYFALTVRIDHYYADVVNLYNLLDAAYNKYIMGTVLEAAGNNVAFKTTDFDQQDALFKSLELEVIHYLMQFSCDKDFVPLSGMKANGLDAAVCMNILECNVQDMYNHVKRHGKISVSPFHPNNQVEMAMLKKDEEIRNKEKEFRQQIEVVRKKAELDILAARAENSNAVKVIKDRCERPFTDAEELRSKLRDAEEKIVRLQDRERVNDAGSLLNRDFIHKLKSWHAEINSGMSLLQIVLLLCILVKVSTGHQSSKIAEWGGVVPDSSSVGEYKHSAEIAISGPTISMKEAARDVYQVSLRNIENTSEGKWVCNGIDMKGNILHPKDTGTFKISYVIKRDTIVTRTVKVMK